MTNQDNPVATTTTASATRAPTLESPSQEAKNRSPDARRSSTLVPRGSAIKSPRPIERTLPPSWAGNEARVIAVVVPGVARSPMKIVGNGRLRTIPITKRAASATTFMAMSHGLVRRTSQGVTPTARASGPRPARRIRPDQISVSTESSTAIAPIRPTGWLRNAKSAARPTVTAPAIARRAARVGHVAM